MRWPKAPSCPSRRSTSTATTCCSCNTPAAPPACRRARRCRIATWWPTPSSSRPSCPTSMRPGEEVIVTAMPLYHIFALMVNFITYFSVGADNWLVPNPRDFDGFLDTLQEGTSERLHGREHALCRAGGAPAQQGGRLVQPAPGRRRWRGGDRCRVRQVEGAHRHLHPRGLRPVGDQPGAELQPGSGAASSPAPPACRCRRPTSS